MTRHCETKAFIPHAAEQVFASLDQHTLLSSHMGKPSWKMGWGRMETELDEGQGKQIGSRIRLAGKVIGMRLSVEEVVAEYSPPLRKVWETVGSPRLLAMGPYRMGFEITPQEGASLLRVFIDYALPDAALAHWLGRLLGGFYARWCVRQMTDDAVSHFITPITREKWP